MKRGVLVALILSLIAVTRPVSGGLASAQPITIGAVYPTGGSRVRLSNFGGKESRSS